MRATNNYRRVFATSALATAFAALAALMTLRACCRVGLSCAVEFCGYNGIRVAAEELP